VAVFGSSEPAPGDEAYEEARTLGRLLGEAGLTVVTGGYGGVMEAASRGAREAGGATIGVTASSLFPHRSPNPFLDRIEDRPDLLDRTRTLMDLPDGFIILPGRAGTLAEAAWLWALQRAGTNDRPRVFLGRPWSELLGELARLELLEAPLREANRWAQDPAEAVRLLTGALKKAPTGSETR
jgi:uncharacterized protein (TIGR00730 family)